MEGLLIFQPTLFRDDRGYFMEFYKDPFFKEILPSINFVQENESKSIYGVLRGLHFQKKPFEQTKLIRVIHGEILDVVVDLRKDSITYGKWDSFILSGKNKKQLLIPRGFAHGFLTLKQNTIINYKVDNVYNKESESGIIYNDPTLNINWSDYCNEIQLSQKDLKLDSFANLAY